MGALLTLLNTNSSGVPGSDPTENILVDFEHAKPSAEEQAVFSKIETKLERMKTILAALSNYKGCSELIRKAISTPGAATEKEAWTALLPCVAQLKEMYDYSGDLTESATSLLISLCHNEKDPVGALEHHQALAKQFALLLHFVMTFDDLKMGNPNIQNDFSYYRRTLSKLKAGHEMLKSAIVKDDLANRMSLFYAYPTPMLRVLIESLTNLMKGPDIPASFVTECLWVMCSICFHAVSKKRVQSQETTIFCLQVMVSCIVLYDHIHAEGAFAKTSPINIRNCIKLIETDGGEKSSNLINALRYSTKHLNDEGTPKQVKQMLQT